MRTTRPTPAIASPLRRRPGAMSLAVGTGLLLAAVPLGWTTAAAAAPPVTALDRGGRVLVTQTSVAPTTTSTSRPKLDVPPAELCRLGDERCRPPVDPCGPTTSQPPVILRDDVTIRTLRPGTTTATRPCPATTTTTRPVVIIIDPPIHVRPTFTG